MEESLLDMRPGETGTICGLQGSRSFVARLSALGFTIGAEVRVPRKDAHGPVLVFLRGTKVALGRGEAERVRVSLAAHEEPVTTAPATGFTVAIAGQPNVGKSTIFNLLTGLNQHVGNWPGKTVERKSGAFSHNNTAYRVIDLPGTYSLSANSEEEQIARDFILKEKPDLVVAVVGAATLERNLYLVAELLLLPAPVLLALNMMDVAEKEGITVEPKVLETALGLPVVPLAAARGRGIEELKAAMDDTLQRRVDCHPSLPAILDAHKPVLDTLQELIAGHAPPDYPTAWVALKLLEGDEQLSALMKQHMPAPKWKTVSDLLYQHEDAVLDIAGARYRWVGRMVRAAVAEPPASRMGLTSQLDRVLTHPAWGTLALALLLGAVFFVTFGVGGPLQELLSRLMGLLGDAIRPGIAGVSPWLAELVAGGLLGGAGMVLTFLPILAVFYLALGFLEDTGYMARAAYITDRLMHKMGLHGKSFLPILLGFGCSVPAILGTRIIESRKARLQTILLVPFVPCTARMAVVVILAPVFFGRSAFLVTWALVAANVIVLVAVGLILHRFVLEHEHVPFVMEMPLYHLPNPKSIGMYVLHNLAGFIRKAGSVILVASLIVWGLSHFPHGDIQTSYLGMAGRWLQPVASLMGLPWQVFVALLTSFAAKENTIATLSVLYGDIGSALPAVVSTAAGLGLLAFQMLFVPCVGTIAVIRQETRSAGWALFAVLLMAALSLAAGVLVFQVGRLF